MSEFAAVRTLADLDRLDIDEVTRGYDAGRHGRVVEPSDQVTRSYWHGWRNGAVDAGRRKPDDAQTDLAAAVIARTAVRLAR